MVGRRSVRTIDRHDVHAREHLVEAFPVGSIDFFLDLRRHPPTIVIVDLKAEGARAPRNRLSDAAHSDDAEPFAPDAMTEHPGRRPAGPVLVGGQHVRAFHQPARHGQDQRHGHVGGILGEDTGRVGDGNSALHRGCHIYIVDAVAEIGDELELVAGLAEHGSIDAIGDGRHQHVGVFHGFGELRLRHRLVVGVEPGVKKLPHPQLDLIGQLARNNDQRLSAFRHLPQTAVSGAGRARRCRFSPH